MKKLDNGMKKKKYQDLAQKELKTFIESTYKSVLSLLMFLFYGFVLFGVFFQEFGSKQAEKIDKENNKGNKVF